jgi:hypothetical protein
VAGGDETRAFGDYRVGDGEIAAADQTEYVRWTTPCQRASDGFGNLHR